MTATRRINSYRDLDVWRKAMALASMAYGLADRLPKMELYGLGSQIRRATVSVPANVAEGHGRPSRAQYRYHVGVAHGSLMELETEVELAVQLGYVTRSEASAFEPLAAEVGRMLHGLLRKLGGAPLTPDP